MIVRNVKRLYIAIGIFVLVMILNLPFPHSVPFSAGNVYIMGIQINGSGGFNFVGLFLIVVLCVGVYLLATSLEKYRVRLVFLALVLYGLLPQYMVDFYQNTFASGIYAISYHIDSSECQFETLDDQRMEVICDLPLENLSDDEVKFDIRFLNASLLGDQRNLIPFINEAGPFEVSLQGRETKMVRIQSEVDISQLHSYSEGGSTHVHIEIVQGNKLRRL
jgi:hypothetical protein